MSIHFLSKEKDMKKDIKKWYTCYETNLFQWNFINLFFKVKIYLFKLENSIYANRIYTQKIKFENEKKIKEKFYFLENDFNEVQKIGNEVAWAIVNNERKN